MSEVDGQSAFRASVLASGGTVDGEPTTWTDDPTPRPVATWDVLTTKQQVAREARIEALRKRLAAEAKANAALSAALVHVTNPIARAVLELHKDENGQCAAEQDDGGYVVSWPCETILTVASALGIPIPKHLQ